MKIKGRAQIGFLLALLIVACATSPLGRKQFIIVPDSQMDQMGVQAFQELRSTEKVDQNPATNAYVKCIVDPLTQTARSQTPVEKWDVVVFDKADANAFALPGGKIGVYSGIIQVAQTPDALAAVLGHEIGHVIARHGAERVSQQAGSQIGLTALGAIAGDGTHRDVWMGLLGVGVQVGVLLPFSRTQESEADLIGLDLMARAGFDPRQSVELWKRMIAASGGKSQPEWLSTHPASENRIQNLESHMPEAMAKYQQVVNTGKTPHCVNSLSGLKIN